MSTRQNIKRSIQIAILSIALVLMSACASKPQMKLANQKDIFHHPADKVQQAAEQAFFSTGFDIKSKDKGYIQGIRPLKPGLIISSGGETVGVWITELEPSKTQVKVHTIKSFIGYAGQKDWGNEILYSITKDLAK